MLENVLLNLKKKVKFSLIAVMTAMIFLFSVPSLAATKPTEQEVSDAYLYMLGRYIVIRQENQDINIDKVGYNTIKYNPLGSAQFVNPNLDVAYLESWIAVDKDSAVIMNVPKIVGRYYTVQVLDGWGEVVTNINERNYPNHPYGKFAFVLKGTSPKNIPKDAVKIEIPSNKIKILARVELQKTPDEAVKLQKQFTLDVPKNIKIAQPVSIPSFTNSKLISVEIFDKVDEVLKSYPDSMPKASEYQATVKKVVEYIKSGKDARAYVDNIVQTNAIPEFLKGAQGFGTQKNGWSVSYVAGKFGNDIMARDIINYGGLWANIIDEAIYFVGLTDNSKQLLNGSNTYEIKFPKDALPDSMVNSFWSITLYSVPDYHVVSNSLNKYGINNVTGAQLNKDGTLSIWLAPTQPKGVSQANWLPTPAGKGFALTFRLYVSKKQVLDGTWFAPPIQKISK